MRVSHDCLKKVVVVFSHVSPAQRLERLKKKIVSCRKCILWKTRTNAVPGEGPSTADLLFIGEAPGRSEDAQGRPFVGRSGMLLDKLLSLAGFQRDEVFIGNVVKCRPIAASGGDRRPTKEEIRVCSPYLEGQITALSPRFICTLGNTATQYLLPRYGIKPESISEMRGRVFIAGSLRIFPTYHPAAALYRKELEQVMKRDFQELGSLVREAQRNRV